MKKLLLLSLALCIGFYTNAQKQAKIPANLLYKSEKVLKKLNGDELPIILNGTNQYVTSQPSKELGLQIGITYYDLQGNSNIGNRMLVYPDGSISAVWTMAPNGTTNYPDRGTGYNHSTNGGTSWGPDPTLRLEGSLRTGWPNINKLTDGSEVDVTHSATGGNLCKTIDGGLTWLNSEVGGSILGLTWPRMVTNGNTIHVIGNSTTSTSYQGYTAGALIYLRSTNGGLNWSDPIIPTGLDTSNYPTHEGVNATFSDAYTLAVKGNTVAFVVGGAYATPALLKSTNNGDTWSYKEILHYPIKKYLVDGGKPYDINNDNQQDVVYSDDGTNFVTLDNSGKAHVFFGKMGNYGDGISGYYYPLTDGMYYWNEDMGTINYQYKWTMINSVNTYVGVPDTVNFPIITEVVDINHNGIMDLPDNGSLIPIGPYYNSLCSQPNAVITPEGTITVFYSSIVEGTDGTVGSEHRAFRNVWEIHKFAGAPNNFTWSDPIRIAEDDYTEEVWPCVSPLITGSAPNYDAHLWYQADGYPGNALQGTAPIPHPITENVIYYFKSKAWFDGINEINVVKSAPVVYPNPASKNVTVSYNLTDAANVTFSIYNIVGQQIMTTTKNVTSGEVNVSLNIEMLPQGVYFIKSDIGNKTYTNKLVVR